jgi:hypothetical protein
VAQGSVPITAPLMFAAQDCPDIGSDLGSPVAFDNIEEAR